MLGNKSLHLVKDIQFNDGFMLPLNFPSIRQPLSGETPNWQKVTKGTLAGILNPIDICKNIWYNITVGWIEERLSRINRREIVIFYDPHYLIREAERNLNIDLVERTVRLGSSVFRKSSPPDHVCFRMYFGKSNETYEAPVKIHKHFLEVKSAWKRKGRH